jgi:hypothetical protein
VNARNKRVRRVCCIGVALCRECEEANVQGVEGEDA